MDEILILWIFRVETTPCVPLLRVC